jgi:hypothetical protein
MKSTDIKNWSYVLSYGEIVNLDDFKELLTEALQNNVCILCGKFLTLLDETTGLCFNCYENCLKDEKEAI